MMALYNNGGPTFYSGRDRDGNFWYGNPPRTEMADMYTERVMPTAKRILVDKTTHRIRFENETELSVVVVIEPKEGL